MKTKTKKSKTWDALEIIIAILILAEIILSSISYYEGKTSEIICIDETACNNVITSQYGTIFGIKVALFGIMSFVLLAAFFILRKKHDLLDKAFLVGSTIGSVFATYFIYLQIFVLKQLCTSCLMVDTTMIIILILSIIESRKRRK